MQLRQNNLIFIQTDTAQRNSLPKWEKSISICVEQILIECCCFLMIVGAGVLLSFYQIFHYSKMFFWNQQQQLWKQTKIPKRHWTWNEIHLTRKNSRMKCNSPRLQNSYEWIVRIYLFILLFSYVLIKLPTHEHNFGVLHIWLNFIIDIWTCNSVFWLIADLTTLQYINNNNNNSE